MADRVIRVCHVAGEPTASRVPQLDLLAERPEIDLTVVYCAATIQRRTWSLEPRHRAVVLDGPVLPTSRLLQHDYPLTPSIWGFLERGGFDCLVVGGWSVFGCQLAMAWARRRHVPYVLFAESHLGEARPGWVRALKRLVVPHAVRPAAAHLVTGTLAREHEIHYGAPPDRIWTFANTVDIDAYRDRAEQLAPEKHGVRRSFGIAEDAFVVLAVNRLLPVKGVEVLVEGFRRAHAAMGVPAHLLIVGDGPDRAALERAAAGLPVSFPGFLEGRRLHEAFAAADVFALLSRRETWGIVVNEAAAFGLPLLLSRGVGAAADLLRDGENGILVDVGAADQVADAIVGLATDPVRRAAMGARAREIVRPWGYGPSVDAYVEAVLSAAASTGRD